MILVVFLLDVCLSVMSYKSRKNPIPANVKDVYQEKDYRKWLNYTMEGFRLRILSSVLDTVILLVFLLTGLFNSLATWVDQLTQNQVHHALLFLGLYGALSYFINLGFKLYHTFSIEERYGFNKKSVKTFIIDEIRNKILLLVVGGGLLWTVISLYLSLGMVAMAYAWGLIMGLILLINLLYARVFIRLFNKIPPLEDGELKDKVLQLSQDLGYEVKSISVMDASKRSSRLNAFFSGFGRFKSIVIYDTLLEKMTDDQVLAVLAHEMGHANHKDGFKNLMIAMVQIGVYMSVLGFFLSSVGFSTAFGFESVHLGFTIIIYMALLKPVSLLINIPLSGLSRQFEYKADAYAKKAGCGQELQEALKILGRENFANLTPHPLVVALTYSHPPIHQRLEALSA